MAPIAPSVRVQAVVEAHFSTNYLTHCTLVADAPLHAEQVTQQIQEKTGHLPGVAIAIMGCIVNGVGEMADADFGYVGGAPGKVLHRSKHASDLEVVLVHSM